MKGNIIAIDYAQTNRLSEHKKFWTYTTENNHDTQASIKSYGQFQDGCSDYVVVKNGSIPEKANKLAQQIKEKNGSPPLGYKGGRTYRNEPENGEQKLPDGVKYREYDVNPYSKGTDRGAERIVIGDDGSVWYTNDHYHTFTQMD